MVILMHCEQHKSMKHTNQQEKNKKDGKKSPKKLDVHTTVQMTLDWTGHTGTHIESVNEIALSMALRILNNYYEHLQICANKKKKYVNVSAANEAMEKTHIKTQRIHEIDAKRTKNEKKK